VFSVQSGFLKKPQFLRLGSVYCHNTTKTCPSTCDKTNYYVFLCFYSNQQLNNYQAWTRASINNPAIKYGGNWLFSQLSPNSSFDWVVEPMQVLSPSIRDTQGPLTSHIAPWKHITFRTTQDGISISNDSLFWLTFLPLLSQRNNLKEQLI
jgi:hypothetical protein